MRYIAQKRGDSPRTRCAKMMNPPKFDTNQQAPTKAARTKGKRKVNNYMIPIQGSGYLHQSCKLNERGTPLDESHKKRIQLHLFNNTERIKNHIFEHAIISLLLDCSNTSQPNNL